MRISACNQLNVIIVDAVRIDELRCADRYRGLIKASDVLVAVGD